MNLGKQAYQNRLHGLSQDWIQRRLGYGSFVARNGSFVFLETPKAACSTMKWVVTHLDGRDILPRHVGKETSRKMCIHYRNVSRMKALPDLSESDFDRILDDAAVIRFCVVRNPYSRLLSAWSSKIRLREPSFTWVWDKVAAHAGSDPDSCPSFESFVNWICETNEPALANPHWQPMTYQLLPDLVQYTNILHTESLEQELEDVLVKLGADASAKSILSRFATNESLPVNWRSFYNAELADSVAQYYAEDFRRFGYDITSWMNADGTATVAGDADNANLLQRMENTALACIRERNDVIHGLHKQIDDLRKRSQAGN